MIKEIKNDIELKEAIQRLESLTDKGEARKVSDIELMEIHYLSMLIKAYEDKEHPIGNPNPVEYLKYILENKNMKQKDLVDLLGITKGTLSSILNYRKKLSIEMIRALHSKLKIPYDILMQDYELMH